MLISDPETLEHIHEMYRGNVWEYSWVYDKNWYTIRFSTSGNQVPQVGDKIEHNRLVKGGD